MTNQRAVLPWLILGMSLFGLLVDMGERSLLEVSVTTEQLHWKVFPDHGLWLPLSLTEKASFP